MWFKNEDLLILVFHSARLKSFRPRGASEEEAFSRSSDIGEQGEAKREAKNENEAGEREEREREREGRGEGFIAALPSVLNHVKAWPNANLHIKSYNDDNFVKI